MAKSGRPAKVAVFVTGQKNCERLINASSALAQELRCEFKVVHIAKTGNNFLGSFSEGEAIEYLFQISQRHGAEMNILRADDVLKTIVKYAKKENITHIVLGGPTAKSTWDLPKLLGEMLPGVERFVIPSDVYESGELREISANG